MSHRCTGKECPTCAQIAEHAKNIKGGTPTKGHPSTGRRGSIYVDPENKKNRRLAQGGMQERLAGFRDSEDYQELVKKVGEKKAKKMVDEMQESWGIPVTGMKAWIKRKLQ